MCDCAPEHKFFYFRYSLEQLNLMVNIITQTIIAAAQRGNSTLTPEVFARIKRDAFDLYPPSSAAEDEWRRWKASDDGLAWQQRAAEWLAEAKALLRRFDAADAAGDAADGIAPKVAVVTVKTEPIDELAQPAADTAAAAAAIATSAPLAASDARGEEEEKEKVSTYAEAAATGDAASASSAAVPMDVEKASGSDGDAGGSEPATAAAAKVTLSELEALMRRAREYVWGDDTVAASAVSVALRALRQRAKVTSRVAAQHWLARYVRATASPQSPSKAKSAAARKANCIRFRAATHEYHRMTISEARALAAELRRSPLALGVYASAIDAADAAGLALSGDLSTTIAAHQKRWRKQATGVWFRTGGDASESDSDDGDGGGAVALDKQREAERKADRRTIHALYKKARAFPLLLPCFEAKHVVAYIGAAQKREKDAPATPWRKRGAPSSLKRERDRDASGTSGGGGNDGEPAKRARRGFASSLNAKSLIGGDDSGGADVDASVPDRALTPSQRLMQWAHRAVAVLPLSAAAAAAAADSSMSNEDAPPKFTFGEIDALVAAGEALGSRAAMSSEFARLERHADATAVWRNEVLALVAANAQLPTVADVVADAAAAGTGSGVTSTSLADKFATAARVHDALTRRGLLLRLDEPMLDLARLNT
jgi:hypothetical protein